MPVTLRDDLKVFRSPVTFVGLFVGFLSFFVVLILDRFAVFEIGWFLHAPLLGYLFLLALGIGCLWALSLIVSLRKPVIMIDQHSITLCQTTVVPARCLEIDLKQVQGVSVWSYPDTVPAYLILDIEQLSPAKRDSAVWRKVKEKRYYYECSNLTVAPSDIAAAIKERLAQPSPAT